MGVRWRQDTEGLGKAAVNVGVVTPRGVASLALVSSRPVSRRSAVGGLRMSRPSRRRIPPAILLDAAHASS